MDIQDFQQMQDSPNQNMQDMIGWDIFGLLDAQNEAIKQEEEREPEEKYIHFKYSETKKKKLLDAFRVTYVNDYGSKDPYHIDRENSFAEHVKNQIHAIYGNRSIVAYIQAMRNVFKVYKELYDHSSNRLIMSFPDFIERIVAGDIPAPFNHPLIRTNVPPEVIMRYILNEKLDPNEIRNYLSSGQSSAPAEQYVFDFTNVERDMNTPVEYHVMEEKVQKRVIQSWLAGKLKDKGLDENESNLVYGMTSVYDKAQIVDLDNFKFDEPISHHSDILSWKNVKRSAPDSVRLKDYTPQALKEKHAGEVIRAIMESDRFSHDDHSSPEITLRYLLDRMEAGASKRNQSITTFRMANKFNLYTQGVIAVKRNKYGREIYKYRDQTTSKPNSVSEMIRNVERKAAVFREMSEAYYERLHSPAFQELIQEIQKEQDIIERYGISYYIDGED